MHLLDFTHKILLPDLHTQSRRKYRRPHILQHHTSAGHSANMFTQRPVFTKGLRSLKPLLFPRFACWAEAVLRLRMSVCNHSGSLPVHWSAVSRQNEAFWPFDLHSPATFIMLFHFCPRGIASAGFSQKTHSDPPPTPEHSHAALQCSLQTLRPALQLVSSATFPAGLGGDRLNVQMTPQVPTSSLAGV